MFLSEKPETRYLITGDIKNIWKQLNAPPPAAPPPSIQYAPATEAAPQVPGDIATALLDYIQKAHQTKKKTR